MLAQVRSLIKGRGGKGFPLDQGLAIGCFSHHLDFCSRLFFVNFLHDKAVISALPMIDNNRKLIDFGQIFDSRFEILESIIIVSKL